MNQLYSSEDEEYVDDYEEHIGNSVKCKKFINNSAVAKKNIGLKLPSGKKTQVAMKYPVTTKPPVIRQREMDMKVEVEKKVEVANKVEVAMEEETVDDWEDLLN